MQLTLVLLAAIAAPALAAVGGRCSNNWGGDCICLDSGVCRNRWGGTPYTGTPGNWPCPYDPDNIMACIVKPCPGQGSRTQCLWRNACRSPNGNPVCPGGNDFICCNHQW